MTTSFATRGTLSFVTALLAGAVSAALFAASVVHEDNFFVYMGYASSLPLFLGFLPLLLVALGLGRMAALEACLTGTILLSLFPITLDTLTYIALVSVPVAALSFFALPGIDAHKKPARNLSDGNLLALASIYPCLIFAIVFAVTLKEPGGLTSLTTTAMHEMIKPFQAQIDPEILPQFNFYMDRVAKLIPAFAGWNWVIMIISGALISQIILTKRNVQKRALFSFRTLQAPLWMVYPVAVCGLASLLLPAPYNYLGINLSLLLGLPFFFGGLAVIHAWAATTRMPILLLFIFYALLCIVIWSSLLVTALGFIDQWGNFRQRLPAGSNRNAR